MKLSLIAVILLDMDNTDICIMGQIPGCDCLIENPNVDHFNNGGYEIPFDDIHYGVKQICPTFSRQNELNVFLQETKSKYPFIKVGFIGDSDTSEIGIYEIEIDKEDLELLEIVQKYKDYLVKRFHTVAVDNGYSGEVINYPVLLDELLCFFDEGQAMFDLIDGIENSNGMEDYGYTINE